MRYGAVLFAAVLFPLCLGASARAESSVDLYLGYSRTDSTTVSAEWSNTDWWTGETTQESAEWSEDFDPSVTVGIGWKGWFHNETSAAELGLGMDAQYFRADGDYAEFWFLPVSLQFLLRVKTLMNENRPDGRLRPYGGVGLGFIFGDGTSHHPSLSRSVGGELKEFGIHFLLGCSWVVGDKTALFLELRRSQFTASTEEGGYAIGGSEKLEADIGATHLLLGVSFL